MAYNPERQYRATIIRGRAKNDMDNLLPIYANILYQICPCNKDEFPLSFNKQLEKVLVISAMVTRGGEHAEKEIPNTIMELEKEFPQVKLVYAYPFLSKDIARFLASQVRKFDSQGE